MIKALLLDLGGTLMVDGEILPGVPQALRVIEEFKIEDGGPLVTCLVSDFEMPEPRTPEAIDAAFKAYLKILDGVDLTHFFEPVDERITLSTHAGVNKPARIVFEMALQRAKVDASLEEALFITEDASHVAASRKLGMAALQFGVDFVDWADAPLLIAHRLEAGANHQANHFRALKLALASSHDVQLESLDTTSGDTVRGRARGWVRLDEPELASLKGVHVEMPVGVTCQVNQKGQLQNVRIIAPPKGDLKEAVHSVQSLVSNRQLAEGTGKSGSSPVIPTHRIETGPDGRRYLRRRRFSAM